MVKPKGNDFKYVPNSPTAEPVAANPTLGVAVLTPEEESPGKDPAPLAPHNPNIGAHLGVRPRG
jgi:hypothetical protein